MTFNKEKCINLTAIDSSNQSEIGMPTFSLRAGEDPLFLI